MNPATAILLAGALMAAAILVVSRSGRLPDKRDLVPVSGAGTRNLMTPFEAAMLGVPLIGPRRQWASRRLL
jgi:hypothetical protein